MVFCTDNNEVPGVDNRKGGGESAFTINYYKDELTVQIRTLEILPVELLQQLVKQLDQQMDNIEH